MSQDLSSLLEFDYIKGLTRSDMVTWLIPAIKDLEHKAKVNKLRDEPLRTATQLYLDSIVKKATNG